MGCVRVRCNGVVQGVAGEVKRPPLKAAQPKSGQAWEVAEKVEGDGVSGAAAWCCAVVE